MKALTAILLFASATAIAQPKVYMLDEVQRRTEKQQWQSYLSGDEDCVVYVDDTTIHANIDQLYHLKIVSTNRLPNDGTVYLCRDEAGRDITITLIGDDRMFLYDEDKRLMINFAKPEASQVTASIAHTEE